MTKKVIVIGGGMAGCSAAVAAAKAGAHVILFERTDMLGGCALLAGRVDCKYITVREELCLMGCDGVFEVYDECKIHDEVEFSFPINDVKKHGNVKKMLYDVCKLDGALYKYLQKRNIEIRLQSRVRDVDMNGNSIQSIVTDKGLRFEADAFVDATGGAGGMDNCSKYGNGCAMCFMRCPSFGNRVSIVEKAGIKELVGKKKDGSFGPFTAAYSLVKESLAPELKAKIEQLGMVNVSIPSEVVDYHRTESITASAHLEKGFAENVVLVDIGGFAKRIAGGYQPLEELRKIPGFENARFADPASGTIGNAVRYMAISPRDHTLRVPGVRNLFIAGEKASVNGLGEVVVTGVIAGHNAVRTAAGLELLMVPEETAVGDFIDYCTKNWDTEDGLKFRFHLFTGSYLDRVVQNGLYTEDKTVIRKRIENLGLLDVLSRKINR